MSLRQGGHHPFLAVQTFTGFASISAALFMVCCRLSVRVDTLETVVAEEMSLRTASAKPSTVWRLPSLNYDELSLERASSCHDWTRPPVEPSGHDSSCQDWTL